MTKPLVLLAGIAAVLTTSLAASAPASLPSSKASRVQIIISMSGCPASIDSGVVQVSGLDVTESDYVSPPTSTVLARCEFKSGSQLIAYATTDLKRATGGEPRRST